MSDERLKIRAYGDDGYAIQDDDCPCGSGAIAVMPDERFGALSFEQHVAGCEDASLADRSLLWLARKNDALRAENERLRKVVEATKKIRATIFPHEEMDLIGKFYAGWQLTEWLPELDAALAALDQGEQLISKQVRATGEG